MNQICQSCEGARGEEVAYSTTSYGWRDCSTCKGTGVAASPVQGAASASGGAKDDFARGVIAALGVLTAHGYTHGSVFHDEIVRSVGEASIYAAAEDEDYKWAGLNPRKKPKGKRRALAERAQAAQPQYTCERHRDEVKKGGACAWCQLEAAQPTGAVALTLVVNGGLPVAAYPRHKQAEVYASGFSTSEGVELQSGLFYATPAPKQEAAQAGHEGALWKKLVADTEAQPCKYPCLRDDLADWLNDQKDAAPVAQEAEQPQGAGNTNQPEGEKGGAA